MTSGGSGPAARSARVALPALPALPARPVVRRAAEAVVLEDHRQRAVVRRAVRVRAYVLRGEGHHQHPRERHREQHGPGGQQVADPGARRDGGGDEVADGQGGDDEPRLHHLGLEGQPHPRAGPHQRAQAGAAYGGLVPVDGQHQAHDQGRVGDRMAEQGGGDGGEGEQSGGQEAGGGALPAAYDPVQDQDGDHAFDALGKSQGPVVEAEEAGGEGLRPEEAADLVEGDAGGRVVGREEEGFPALGHAAGGDRVVRGQAADGDVPRVQECGQGRDAEQRGPCPAGLAFGRAPHLPAAARPPARCGVRR